MKINLVLIGKTNIDWVANAVKDYSARLGHYVPFSITIIPDIKNAANLSQQELRSREGEAILKAVAPNDEMWLLDERGGEFTSVEFALRLEKTAASLGSRNLVFVIGGAYGFSDDVYARANNLVALSKMTFSHQMVRAIFVEQLYRAFTILKGEKYHH